MILIALFVWMEHIERTVVKTALITVTIALVMCLVYVYLVVERVG